MKFKVLTLFPEMIMDGLKTSITGRALENNLIELEAVNIREYSLDKHGKVDDYTYGGGAGMLMQAQPVYDAWQAQVSGRKTRTIYVTPQGRLFSQAYAAELAQEEELIFLCGHYEGIDQRVLDEVVTDYVSIGDYVLTGGELPAMVMIDAISRLIPGVLHNEESAETESFHRNLLEYPQYSRPEVWHGQKVPDVLLSGDHRKIAAWRMEQSERLTRERRPDLYAKYERQEAVIQVLLGEKRLHIHMIESLRRGRGEVICWKDRAVCVYDPDCRLGMFTVGSGRDAASQLIEAIPQNILDDMRFAVTTDIAINRELADRLSGDTIRITSEGRMACYTQRTFLPVKYKDIRLLQEADQEYPASHWEWQDADQPAERIRAKAFYGAYAEDRLIGFCGWLSDGRIGYLYVEEEYRRQGIGTSLEAFCINRQLEMGFVPYGFIPKENEVALKMQINMGLYLSEGCIWWLERS